MGGRKGRRQTLKGGLEYDVHTRWRHVVCIGRGMTKFAKHTANRRERIDAKKEIEQEVLELYDVEYERDRYFEQIKHTMY